MQTQKHSSTSTSLRVFRLSALAALFRFRANSFWVLALAFATMSLWTATSHSYVNYVDPNLGERPDVIAQAALDCNLFRQLPEQFNQCLSKHGVTDTQEQSDAAQQARASFSANNFNGAAVSTKKEITPPDAVAENGRAPAAVRSAKRRSVN